MTHHLLRNLLSQNGFIMLNKAMVKSLGKDKALLLSFAIDKWAYNDGGNFYYTISDICEDIGICDKTARKILAELLEDGLIIKKEFTGLPPKQYYQINGEAIISILSQPNIQTKKDGDIDGKKTGYNTGKKSSDINNKNTCTRTHVIKTNSLENKATSPSRVHEQAKTQTSPICQKPFFEASDFQEQDNITQSDLDYLNTFSNSLAQEQENYKRELGLFIIHRKTHKKHTNLSELALRQLLTKLKTFSSLKSIKEALIESVINGWAGVFEPKQTKGRFEYNTHNEYDTGDNSIYLRHALRLDKNNKN